MVGNNLWANISDLGPKVIKDTAKRISDEAVSKSRLRIVSTGSLLFSFKLSIGQVSFAGCDMYTNEAIAAFRSSKSLDLRFAFYAFPLFIVQNASDNIYGAKLLNQDLINSAVLALPPITEQSSIASFLDRETAKIDALVEEQQRLIELLKEKRQAVISHAVTKGLDPSTPMKDSGVEWLGEVPEHWDVMPLAYLTRHGTTVTYGIVQAGPDVEGGIPYIRTSDMAGDSLPAEGYLRTSTEIDRSYARSKVNAGDLVIAIRATIGKPLIVPPFLEGANLTQGTARFSPNDSVNVEYVQLFLKSAGAEQEFQRLGKGATFKEITLEMLRKFRIARPPLKEQEAIVRFLKAKTEKTDTLLGQVEKATVLLQERRSALISAAVTGKIDVRDLVPVEAEAA